MIIWASRPLKNFPKPFLTPKILLKIELLIKLLFRIENNFKSLLFPSNTKFWLNYLKKGWVREIAHLKVKVSFYIFLKAWRRQKGFSDDESSSTESVFKGRGSLRRQRLFRRGGDAAGGEDEDEEHREGDHHLVRPELLRQNETGILRRKEIVRKEVKRWNGESVWRQMIDGNKNNVKKKNFLKCNCVLGFNCA